MAFLIYSTLLYTYTYIKVQSLQEEMSKILSGDKGKLYQVCINSINQKKNIQ